MGINHAYQQMTFAEFVEKVIAPPKTRTSGTVRRDRGAAKVEANTPDPWKTACDQAIQKLASTGREFTAEDVRAVVGDPPNHPNAMGGRFLAAARAGHLEKTGYRNPSRASRHASVIAVWRGKGAA